MKPRFVLCSTTQAIVTGIHFNIHTLNIGLHLQKPVIVIVAQWPCCSGLTIIIAVMDNYLQSEINIRRKKSVLTQLTHRCLQIKRKHLRK